MTPKVRKTYVVNYLDHEFHLKQEYRQTYQQAKHARFELAKNGFIRSSITWWIDGAEMLRLARLGYTYDREKNRAVKMKHFPRKFLKEVDAMSEERRNELYLDYRNFKNSDDVIAFYQKTKVLR